MHIDPHRYGAMSTVVRLVKERMMRLQCILVAPFILTAPLTLFLASVSAAQAIRQLIPMPREYHDMQSLSLAAGIVLVCRPCNDQDAFTVADLQTTLKERGVTITPRSRVSITFLHTGTDRANRLLAGKEIDWKADAMDAEGYVLLGSRSGLSLIAASSTGMFYGAQTIKQLIDTSHHPVELRNAVIRDWPALKIRGLSEDLSRGPIPTLNFLKSEIRHLAAYKINLYSPYFEQAMEYASNPLIAPAGGAMSMEEARELVSYAKQFHISIVPEQEAFGHLHSVLNWEMYAPLAETPHGQVLAPGKTESLELARQMFTELAGTYPGTYIHLGADETQDLGKGQTRGDVDKRGLGAVYLDYLQRLVTELRPLNRKFLYWGDVALHSPELLKPLSQTFKDSTIAVPWVYDVRPEGYASAIKPFTDAGIECWVAPGISNWSRVYPNYHDALLNIQQFSAEGQADGCTGQMNTIWNDDGETLINSDWYGILFGAAAAWQPGVAAIPTYHQTYGSVFHGDDTGKIDAAQLEIMAAHTLLKEKFKRSDASDLLFWVDPWSVDGQLFASQIRPYASELRLHAEKTIVLIRQARRARSLRELDALDAMELGALRMDLIGLKFQVSDEIAGYYADAEALSKSQAKQDRDKVGPDLDVLNSTNGKLQDMRDAYSLTRDLYAKAWLRSNRPYWLHNNLNRYDMTIQMWLGRIDMMRAVQRQWLYQHSVPPASKVGIPRPVPAPVAP